MSDTSLRLATRTDVGLVRKRNEDFLATRSVPLGQLLVVCDGMGGAAGGVEASTLAAAAIVETVETAQVGEDRGVVLERAYNAAWRGVKGHVASHPEHEAMGTTAVVALVHDGRAVIANIGDSRAYHLQGGVLRRVTRDHSLVAEMVERGEITEVEAATHPRRNVITRAISARDRDVQPDIVQIVLNEGDTLLLCSDGLHGMIDDGAIATLLLAPDLAGVADRLVEAALGAGGKDNVSVVLARRGGPVESDTLVAPRTNPGAAPSPARVGGRWIVPLVLLAALAAAWFLWVGPQYFPRSPFVPGGDSTEAEVEGVGQYDTGAGDDLLQELGRIARGALGTPPAQDHETRDTSRINDTTGNPHATPQPAAPTDRPPLPGR